MYKSENFTRRTNKRRTKVQTEQEEQVRKEQKNKLLT